MTFFTDQYKQLKEQLQAQSEEARRYALICGTGTIATYAWLTVYHVPQWHVLWWVPFVYAAVGTVKAILTDKGEVVKGDDGNPKEVVKPKYSLHALRHAAAALFIE